MPTVRELLTKWGFSIDKRPLEALERSISDVKRSVAAVGAVAISSAAGLFGLAEGARRYIDTIDEMAQSAGVNAQFFAELSAAAKLGGASVEDVGTAMAVFNRKIVEAREGSAEAAKSFADLGISADDLKTMPAEALFMKVADGMAKTTDRSKRVALAFDLLGRGGRRMLPTIMEGAEGLAKLGDEARRFGMVPGPAAIAAADAMEKSMGRAKAVVAGLALQVGTELMPVVSDIANRFTEWAEKNRELIATKVKAFIEGLTTAVRVAWDATSAFVLAMKDMVSWFIGSEPAIVAAKGALAAFMAMLVVQKVKQFSLAIKGLALSMKALWLAMAANPIMVAILAISAIIASVIVNWDDWRYAALATWWAIRDAYKAAAGWLMSNVWSPIVRALGWMSAQMTAAWTATTDAFKAAWQGVADWFRTYVTDPIGKAVGAAEWVGDKLRGRNRGVGGLLTGMISHSPGRPGSPESNLRADRFSTGLRYNPALAATMGGGRSAVLNVGGITVNMPAGSNASAADVGAEVRRAVRHEIDYMTRSALADMG